MVHMQEKVSNIGSAPFRTIVQLLFCHCIIFTVAIIAGAQMLTILCACLLSFLLLLNIPYHLYQLEMALERLVHGLAAEPISLRWRWPLTPLFILVNTLTQQTGQQIQLEKRTVAYRDQLLQQVSKTAAQEERNRLARDLHDSIKQQLFSIAVSAAAVKARLTYNTASALTIVEDIERIARETQVEMQVLLQQLRPTALENVGLLESLRLQCQALGYRTGAAVTAELGELPPDELLPLGAQEMIFRIVQEGFANIARHARATQVWLSLQCLQDVLLIEIGDHGQGFDLSKAHEHNNRDGGMGLSNVRERVLALGGKMAIWSLPNKGTTLHVCIPLLKPQGYMQEQERISQGYTVALERSHHILRSGTLAEELAAALMLLSIPASVAQWLVLLCLIVACSCWLWSQQSRSALHFRQKRAERFSVLAHSHGLLSGLLLLSILYLTYFDAFRAALYTAFLSNNIVLLLSLLAVLLGLLSASYLRFARYTDLFYEALSRQSLRVQLRQLHQQIGIDWTMWLLLVALTVFLAKWFPSILIDTTTHYIGITMLCIWFLVLLLKSIRIMRWQNVLHKREQRATVATDTAMDERKEGRV